MSVGKYRLLGELIDSDISREGVGGSSMVRSGLLRDILNEHAELLEALETARIALIAVADSAVEAGFDQLADIIDEQLGKANIAIARAIGTTSDTRETGRGL